MVSRGRCVECGVAAFVPLVQPPPALSSACLANAALLRDSSSVPSREAQGRAVGFSKARPGFESLLSGYRAIVRRARCYSRRGSGKRVCVLRCGLMWTMGCGRRRDSKERLSVAAVALRCPFADKLARAIGYKVRQVIIVIVVAVMLRYTIVRQRIVIVHTVPAHRAPSISLVGAVRVQKLHGPARRSAHPTRVCQSSQPGGTCSAPPASVLPYAFRYLPE